MAFTVYAGTGVAEVWYDWYTYAGSMVGYVHTGQGSFTSSHYFSTGYIKVYIDLEPGYYNCSHADGSEIYSTTTITAQKCPQSSYTLSYHKNGGDGGTTSPQSGSTTYTVRSCGFYRNGYSFSYWTAPNGTIYYPGNTITLYSDTTLYAQWTKNITYTLSYDGNNATGGSTSQQDTGTTYTVKECGFYKTGYRFDYWQTASGTRYNPGDTITLTSDVKLYAHWSANTYTISYNANGGSGAPGNQTKYYGTTLTLSSTKPTWSGYTFIGWASSSDRKANVEYLAGASYTLEQSITLYAVWNCTIAFYSKDQLQSAQYPRIGARVTLPTLDDTDTETFEGWTLDGETFYGGSTITVMSSHNLYAIWKLITYKIEYKPGGATSGETRRQTGAQTYIIRECGFDKIGFIFDFWIDEDAVSWFPGDSVTPTKDMVLTAVWKVKRYFTWHGSDEADASYFAPGKRIDLAVTAPAWNDLYSFINEVRRGYGMPTIAWSPVTAGQPITTVLYNIVSNAINQIVLNGHGSVTPVTVSTGQEITTSLFNGPGSLKDAINSAAGN